MSVPNPSLSVPNPNEVRELREAMVEAGPACTTADAELFTGPDSFDPEPLADRMEREKQAKQICLSCPARPECLAYALDVLPNEGVWAGLTYSQIRSLSFRLKAADAREVA